MNQEIMLLIQLKSTTARRSLPLLYFITPLIQYVYRSMLLYDHHVVHRLVHRFWLMSFLYYVENVTVPPGKIKLFHCNEC